MRKLKHTCQASRPTRGNTCRSARLSSPMPALLLVSSTSRVIAKLSERLCIVYLTAASKEGSSPRLTGRRRARRSGTDGAKVNFTRCLHCVTHTAGTPGTRFLRVRAWYTSFWSSQCKRPALDFSPIDPIDSELALCPWSQTGHEYVRGVNTVIFGKDITSRRVYASRFTVNHRLLEP